MRSISSFKKHSLALAVCHALLMDVQAATIEVNNNGDAGIGCTLREAISNAENNNDGGGNGCDSGSAVPDNVTFDMGSLASPTITLSSSLIFSINNSVITIDGPSDGSLVIDGAGADNIMRMTLTGPLTLNHLTLQNGSATHGGALNITTTLVTLNNCTISNNQATQRGAGIYVTSSGLFINDSTISGNFSEVTNVLVGRGGGIYSADSPVQINNSLISANRARYSGGIYSVSGTNVSLPALGITNSIVENNISDVYGGGIDKRFADILIANSTVRNNTSALRGGGLFTLNAEVEIIDSTLARNTATASSGGGAFINSGGKVTINRSTFSNNIAGSGGGGGIELRSSQSNISNSTVSSNQASSGSGGGITVSTSGYLNLINSTVVANSANLGGGLVLANASANMDISNSIIAGNTANNGAEIGLLSAQPISTSGVNLFGENSNDNASAFFNGFTPGVADITATVNGSLPTLLNSIVDLSLSNNGGTTFTHNLVSNSPAINTADTSICGPGKIISIDQRGENRDQQCDIGSIEFSDDETCFVVPTSNASVAVFCI